MSLDPDQLRKILRGAHLPAVVKCFAKAPEIERKAMTGLVVEWSKRLDLNFRAQFNAKAREELVATKAAVTDWFGRTPTCVAAALACASMPQIKAMNRRGQLPPEIIVDILKDRRPPWIADYAEWLCEGGAWKCARALVVAGLCAPPKHDNYVLGALLRTGGIWPARNIREIMLAKNAGKPLPEPVLVDLLLAERDWLETDFWRLFEIEGTAEVSLANSDKYGKNESWTEAIIELAQRGVLSRDHLLDASMAALSRDFIQFRSGWFSRFHEALKPTPEERAARLDAYLRLLASSIPPTTALALNAVIVVDKSVPLPARRLTSALAPVLSARGKAVVKTALQLLDRVAGREPSARKEICLAVLPSLLNEAVDTQKVVLDLLEEHGDSKDAELGARVGELSDAVAASLKPWLAKWLGSTPPKTSAASLSKPSEEVSSCPPLSRLDPARAIQPIDNLDDLILAASAVLEEPDKPEEIERVLDGLSRLCDQRPPDFARGTGPLRKRAAKKRDEMRGSWLVHPELQRVLGMLYISWIDQQDGFTEKPVDLARGQNQFAFLFRRLAALSRHAQGNRPLPLLSAPTHQGGWINARILVARWQAWQKAGIDPDLHEQVLAMLRLAPEGRARALAAAGAIEDEAGRALRCALGGPAEVGRNAALWLAVWRSRQPFGDLPEFEKVHPGLGPDTGVAAHYTWRPGTKVHHYQNSDWTSFELEVKTEPSCPKNIGDALLPMLFHGERQTSEEGAKPLMRWGSLLWPANREATFAHAAYRLQSCLGYSDALDREFAAYLEPLADPHTELRPMACLTLALGLAAQESALRGHAQEGLIASISEGRLPVEELGATMARLLDTGFNRFPHWAKSLGEATRVSPRHAQAAADLLQRAFHAHPAAAPRDLHKLLELLVELLSETGRKLEDPQAREYLVALSGGGKTARLAKQLLKTS